MRIHDGAYGTLLARHLHGGETVDDLCVRRPDLVVDAHRAYLDAGARAIQTNAFLAHLRGSARRRTQLRDAALECARQAVGDAGTDAVVVATIGPAGNEPRDFWESIEHALESEATVLLCETVTTLTIADSFLAAWSEVAAGVCDVEVMLGCSADPGDAEASRWIVDLAGAATDEVLVGLNCCEGPVAMRGLLETIIEQRGSTWAMPSAGVPSRSPSAVEHPWSDPREWGEAVVEQVDGLALAALGGCCGTTPDSIESLLLPA